GEGLRVAVLAARADLGAPTNGVPRRVGPLDGTAVAHAIEHEHGPAAPSRLMIGNRQGPRAILKRVDLIVNFPTSDIRRNQELYLDPGNDFIARMLGSKNWRDAIQAGDLGIQTMQ